VEAHAISSALRRRPAAEARTRADLRIGALGSGSDYTAFLDHLGIASMNLGFGAKAAVASTIPSTTISIGTPTSPIPISSTAARASPNRRHGRDAPGGRRSCCPSISTTSPRPSAATSTNSEGWRTTSARGHRRAQPRDRRGRLRGPGRPALQDRAATQRAGAARS